MIQFQNVVKKLENNATVFEALFHDVSEIDCRWKPAPEKWSLLEVLNHLLDEEMYDFRQRIEFALTKPDREWIRIQPTKWVVEKAYIEKDFRESLDRFLLERKKSIQWLREHENEDWTALDNYPHGNSFTAESLLLNWLAHDYLHIRQINALHREFLAQELANTPLDYAGTW